MNLIDLMEKPYPLSAGWKAEGTSREAAEKVDAKTLRARVLTELAKSPGTADEIAHRLHIDRLSIRPRLSELSALGRVEDSGVRRVNESGKRAVVWRLTPLAMVA